MSSDQQEYLSTLEAEASQVWDRLYKEFLIKRVISLTDLQAKVFKHSWMGCTYSQIAEKCYLSEQTVKDVGYELWRLLSEVLELPSGIRVTKKNLQEVLRQASFSHSPSSTELAPAKDTSVTTYTSTLRLSRQDWGEAPSSSSSSFYGRSDEIATLERWILTDRCRLIAILGIGGIGKTTLSVKLGKGGIGKSTLSLKVAEQIQEEFEYVIWRSLLGEPSVENILEDLLKFFSGQQEYALSSKSSNKVLQLLSYLQQHRCLIILDNVESVLRSGKYAGQYRDGFEAYGTLFKQLGEAEHQSCVVLTSREKPQEIALLEGGTRPIRSLHLAGLNKLEGRQIFQDNGNFSGSDEEWQDLIEFYNGNPLALDIVAKHIRWAFQGSISRFIQDGKNIFGDLRDLLDWHFNRLSEAEQEIMYWLAIRREPISIESLKETILLPSSKEKVAENLQLLERRLPIERTTKGFTLQPVLIEYVAERLIQNAYEEIQLAKPNIFNSHALIEAQAKDYIREAQIRVILQPLVARMSTEKGRDFLLSQLKKIISKARKNKLETGYVGGNVINLLIYMGVDLNGYDFSQIPIWQAYLQRVNLSNVNFAYSSLSKTIFTQTFGSISSVRYSPDGQFLAVGHTKNEISIWNVSNGQQISVCRGHVNWIKTIAFSPDSQFLASGSEDGIIKLWDVVSGGCFKTISGHAYKVLSVTFSPDGETIVSGSGDNTIKLWNVSNGDCLRTLQGHSGWIFSVIISPDGETIASGSGDNTIKLWNANNGKCLKTLQGHTKGISSISFNFEGRILASGSFDKTLRLWDVGNGKCLKTFHDHTNDILSVAFNPTNQTLASGSSDRTIRIWDLQAGRCVEILRGHYSHVWSLDYSANGQTIISGSGDQTVRIWEVQDGRCLKILQGHINSVWTVAYVHNEQLVFAGCEDGSIRIWDNHFNQFRDCLQGHSHIVWSVAFSTRRGVLASGSGDRTVKLWEMKEGRCIRTLQGHTDAICSIAFSPDGEILASASRDQTIRLWSVRTGECTTILRETVIRIRSITFSPNGQLLASGNDDQTVKVWQVQDQKCLQILRGHTDEIGSVAFSPDGQTIASGSSDRTVRLWNIASGKTTHLLQEHTNDVTGVCFSPDGKLLATCSMDQTIVLWRTCNGQALKVLRGHTNSVCSVTFGFDAQNLIVISSSEDETIRFWDIKTGNCFKMLNIPRPYEGANITGVKGLTEAQKAVLKILGAVEVD